MHSRENPINSSNQVIDSISPSAWAPNRSQEKGFPEAAPVSRNGQMSFFVRGQRRPDLSRARNEAQCQNQQHGLCVGLSTLKLPCNHSTLQYFPHFFSVLRKQKREKKGLDFKTLNIDRCLHACLPHPKKQEMMIDVFDQNPICNSSPCV